LPVACSRNAGGDGHRLSQGVHADDERALLCHGAPEDVKRLVWDSNCGINLANYLTDRKEKIAASWPKAATRAISSPTSSKTRSSATSWYIIGVPCTGMIDKRKITNLVDGEILEVAEDDNTIKVKGAGFGGDPLRQVRGAAAKLRVCIHRNPVIHDEMVADPVEEQKDIDRYADIRTSRRWTPKKNGSFR
jgi:formate dehydrogenase subunit beta